jgi:hypothetical protein
MVRGLGDEIPPDFRMVDIPAGEEEQGELGWGCRRFHHPQGCFLGSRHGGCFRITLRHEFIQQGLDGGGKGLLPPIARVIRVFRCDQIRA